MEVPPSVEKHLVPNWKQVLCRAWVVRAAIAGMAVEIAMFLLTNLDILPISDGAKLVIRMILGIAVIVLRPLKQQSLHDSSQPAPERSPS